MVEPWLRLCVMCWEDQESRLDMLCLFQSALQCLAVLRGWLWTLLWVVKLTIPDISLGTFVPVHACLFEYTVQQRRLCWIESNGQQITLYNTQFKWLYIHITCLWSNIAVQYSCIIVKLRVDKTDNIDSIFWSKVVFRKKKHQFA